MRELTPLKKMINMVSNADAYLEFIVKTLKPQIDQSTELRQKKKDIHGCSSLYGFIMLF
jgi:predicted alpha/beta superfamily hydrolase